MGHPDAVAGVVLAAGRSRRFRAPKQLALLRGKPLLAHVLDIALEAGLEPVVAVVPVWLTPPAGRPSHRLRWIRNPSPERGMAHSLRLALQALEEATGAALVLLGDQPTLPGNAIAAVIAARGSRPVVAARAQGRIGHPVLIERSHWWLVDEISGDGGLRTLLQARPELVTPVSVAMHAADVDTPEDLRAMEDA
ncbi:MAG: nucleotidyltransferase family protein [Candidatus Limnocylindria bacterium]